METLPLSRSEQRIQDRAQLQEYVNARIQGATPHGAALEAGYTEHQASNACRAIEPKVKKRIADYLEQHGAGNEDVARVVGEAMRAETTGKYGTQPDHFIRLKAAQFTAEATGQIKVPGNVAVNVQINLPAGAAERMGAYTLTANEDGTYSVGE